MTSIAKGDIGDVVKNENTEVANSRNGVGNTSPFGVLDPPTVKQHDDEQDKENDTGIITKAPADLKRTLADEAVEIIKAKAGYDLVDTILGEDSRTVKILYMTNKQAVRVAKDSTAMRKMEMALFGDNPRYLIIDLVQSWGFYSSTKILDENYFENTKENKWNAGIEYASHPFQNLQEEQETINQINHFMLNVIIPLAEKTSAIVVCNAVVNDCILAECFTNMVESMSSKWEGEPPFAIVGILGSVDVLYNNNKQDATWNIIRKACHAWDKRHNGILDTHFTSAKKKGYHHDLCWTTSKLVIIEGLDTKVTEKESWAKKNKAPFSLFMTKLMRLVGENAPQLAFKTGACTRDDHVQRKHYRGIQDMSYRNLLDRINAGASIVCLDVRKRDNTSGSNQAPPSTNDQDDSVAGNLQETPATDHNQTTNNQSAPATKAFLTANNQGTAASDVKKEDEQNNKELWEKLENIMKTFYQASSEHGPTMEALDCCLLAHLSNLLQTWKEDKARIIEKDTSTGDQKKDPLTLAEKIQNLTEEKEKHDKNDHRSSSKDDPKNGEPEINFVNFANTFAWEFYKSLPLPDNDPVGEKESRQYFASEIQTTASFAMQLLMSNNFQGMNIWDRSIQQAAIIDKIVLSGFETNSSLEGLELLKKAWDAVDNSRDLATKYQKISNILYFSQLTLGLLLTFVSVMVGYELFPKGWKRVVLWLSLALGVFASIDTILSPRSYWYQLRKSQVALESIIWKYRTRVGQFEVDRTNSNEHRPVQNLRLQLEDWGDQLVAGSKNTSATGVHGNWGKRTISRIFGNKSKVSCDDIDNGDDHYSYVDGKQYVKWRVEPLIEQYRSKIPRGLFSQYKFEIIIVILGVSIAIVSEQIEGEWSSPLVAIITAFVAFLTSWIEFKAVTTEANMLSSAIQECNNQVYRWTELTKFMAQSRNITNVLVEEVERIAMEVMTSWSTSISKKSETSNAGDINSNDSNRNGQHVSFPLRNIREQSPADLTDQL